MEKLSDLPNIGKEVERQLNTAGIMTFDELKALGAKQAWLKIQETDDSVDNNNIFLLKRGKWGRGHLNILMH